jgi:hypothetical protein
MVKFAETFSEPQIVSSLTRQLSWTHFLSLIYIADPLKRDFYAEMCRVERWSTRVLREKIDFKPADAGQVDLYLRWLDRNERQPGEEAPMALIL